MGKRTLLPAATVVALSAPVCWALLCVRVPAPQPVPSVRRNDAAEQTAVLGAWCEGGFREPVLRQHQCQLCFRQCSGSGVPACSHHRPQGLGWDGGALPHLRPCLGSSLGSCACRGICCTVERTTGHSPLTGRQGSISVSGRCWGASWFLASLLIT